MDDLKTMPPSERDELNEHLDELRRSQQESANKEQSGKTSGEKKRSRWGCLIGTLAAFGGIFLFWRTACRPQVLCYMPVPNRGSDGEEVRPTCYEIVIPDDIDDPAPEFDPAGFEPNMETPSSDAEAEAAAEAAINDLQEYYEKVKQESPVNNNNSDVPTED